MQVKYIVYYPAPRKPPKVALWLTSDGSMTHVKYLNEHNISPQSLSSLGYINYSPFWKKYILEHYQNNTPTSLGDLIKHAIQTRRDKLLIRREICRNPILKNPRVQQGSYQDLLMYRKARENCNGC